MNGFVIIQTQDDMRWWADGDRNGWELPVPASRFWRRWPFRLYRFARLSMLVDRHDRVFASLGLIPTGFDRWVLYAIRRDWC